MIAEDLWDASAVYGVHGQSYRFLGHADMVALLSLAAVLIPSERCSLLTASGLLWLAKIGSSTSKSFREPLSVSELPDEQLLSDGLILGLGLSRNDILPAIGLGHMLHVLEVLLLFSLFLLQFLFDLGNSGVHHLLFLF